MYLLNKVAAIKEGNTVIFGELFNEYHQKVYFYILAKTKSNYLAEEVTQLTFIKLWNYRQSLDESISASAQIFRIAKTTCIDLIRKEANKSKLSLAFKDSTPYSNNVSDSVDKNETERRLSFAVQKMPPMRRKVFEMSRYESKSHKEISQLLSLSEKTVENHITLALKQLRRVFFLLFIFFII